MVSGQSLVVGGRSLMVRGCSFVRRSNNRDSVLSAVRISTFFDSVFRVFRVFRGPTPHSNFHGFNQFQSWTLHVHGVPTKVPKSNGMSWLR